MTEPLKRVTSAGALLLIGLCRFSREAVGAESGRVFPVEGKVGRIWRGNVWEAVEVMEAARAITGG